MKCPVDQAVLEISNRNNIEIDYCPTCRGVWLDRGELDKIIERSESSPAPGPVREAPQQRYEEPRRERSYEDDRRYSGDSHQQPHKKKRESFLGDLFDF